MFVRTARSFLFGISLLSIAVSAIAQNGMTLIGSLDNRHGNIGTQNYSGSWGYVAPDGREYAILGTVTGTSIIDITDAPTLVEVIHIAGPGSQWREMRTHKDRLYVVTEAGGGTQIIDLSQLPTTATLVKSYTYTNGGRSTSRAHSLQIADGYLYLNGCANWGTTAQRGAVIFSLADPDNPVYVGEYAPNYFHDSYVRHDTIFGASIYGTGGIYIADIKNKSAPIPIGKISYTGSGTHNVSTTKDGRYLISSDEIGTTPKTLKFWDISALPTIPTTTVATYSYSPADIEHNVFVRGNYAYTAWYTGGIAVTDVRTPSTPTTAGWYDTYPGTSGGYNGVWGAYPYFWSGKIIAGDMQTGLYVFTFDSLPPRTPTSLAEPANAVEWCDASPITFRWTSVANQQADPHEYLLTVQGPGIDSTFTTGADTFLTLTNMALLDTGIFRWWVTVKDEANMVPSEDTLTIVRPFRRPFVVSPNGGEYLKVNSEVMITWTTAPTCLDSVEIAYSTDNGSSWIIIESAYPASLASYVWTVPMTPTLQGRLRVRNAHDSVQSDVSDGGFEIFNSGVLAVIAPNGNEVYTAASTAQISWSSAFVGDVAVDYTTDNGSTWFTVAVDTPATLGSIEWVVPNIMTNLARVRISDITNPTVFDESDGVYSISPLTFPVAPAWNLVSMPVEPASRAVPVNFPTAASSAFEYLNGYVVADSIEQGKGYWVRYVGASYVAAIGSLVASDTIPVNERWNMIGSISTPIAVASISPLPGTMTITSFHGFSPDSGYYVTDTLRPGSGYWVKASEAGGIVLPSSASVTHATPEVATEAFPPNSITFTDAKGAVRTLYVDKAIERDTDNTMRWELPPPPPSGIFDVRFTTGSNVAILDENNYGKTEIAISSLHYPLTVLWNVRDAGVMIGIDQKEIPLAGTGRASIEAGTARVRLFVTSVRSATPGAFRLEQNYPNPFNPSTRIRYALPAESRVTLKVFDVLGREIATLVDGIQSAGYKEVEWDARQPKSGHNTLGGGIYFYKLTAGGVSETRKMLLTK